MVDVEYIMDAAAEERLQQYINGIGEVLGHPKRREAFASYTLGLLSDLERKSIEPMGEHGAPPGCGQRLLCGQR